MDFYLGIDIGTSRVKAVLFDQHFTRLRQRRGKHLTPSVGQWLRGTGYDPAVAFGAGYSAPDCPPPGAVAGRLRAIGLAGQGRGSGSAMSRANRWARGSCGAIPAATS